MAGTGKILIVEDKAKWQEILRHILEKEGYEVEEVSDYSSALKIILSAGLWTSDFDLTLCLIDLRLESEAIESNYNGLGLLALCKVNKIPTIVVSGFLNSKLKNHLEIDYKVQKAFDKKMFSEEEFIKAVHSAAISPTEDVDGDPAQALRETALLVIKLETLTNMVNERYQEAYFFINEKQKDRQRIRGKTDPDDEAIWLEEHKQLGQSHQKVIASLIGVHNLSEFEEVQVEVIKECGGWMSGLEE